MHQIAREAIFFLVSYHLTKNSDPTIINRTQFKNKCKKVVTE